MTHYLASDNEYRGLSESGEHLPSLARHRFGLNYGKRLRGRSASSRVKGWAKAMIEAIADSKLRRMERELELRGIRYDRPDDGRLPKSQPTGHLR